MNIQETRKCIPQILKAEEEDLENVLRLQKIAFMIEARIYNNFNIAPLQQTLDELKKEAETATILKAVLDNRLVGSVRAYELNGTCYIGRLVVHPEYQNRGIGKKLMEGIEECFGGQRYELFTGHLSEKNIAFYQKLGYKIFKTEQVADNLSMIYFEK